MNTHDLNLSTAACSEKTTYKNILKTTKHVTWNHWLHDIVPQISLLRLHTTCCLQVSICVCHGLPGSIRQLSIHFWLWIKITERSKQKCEIVPYLNCAHGPDWIRCAFSTKERINVLATVWPRKEPLLISSMALSSDSSRWAGAMPLEAASSKSDK